MRLESVNHVINFINRTLGLDNKPRYYKLSGSGIALLIFSTANFAVSRWRSLPKLVWLSGIMAAIGVALLTLGYRSRVRSICNNPPASKPSQPEKPIPAESKPVEEPLKKLDETLKENWTNLRTKIQEAGSIWVNKIENNKLDSTIAKSYLESLRENFDSFVTVLNFRAVKKEVSSLMQKRLTEPMQSQMQEIVIFINGILEPIEATILVSGSTNKQFTIPSLSVEIARKLGPNQHDPDLYERIDPYLAKLIELNQFIKEKNATKIQKGLALHWLKTYYHMIKNTIDSCHDLSETIEKTMEPDKKERLQRDLDCLEKTKTRFDEVSAIVLKDLEKIPSFEQETFEVRLNVGTLETTVVIQSLKELVKFEVAYNSYLSSLTRLRDELVKVSTCIIEFSTMDPTELQLKNAQMNNGPRG